MSIFGVQKLENLCQRHDQPITDFTARKKIELINGGECYLLEVNTDSTFLCCNPQYC